MAKLWEREGCWGKGVPLLAQEGNTLAPTSCLNHGGLSSIHRRSEEHTSELQSHSDLVCRLLLEKKRAQVWKTVTEGSAVPAPACEIAKSFGMTRPMDIVVCVSITRTDCAQSLFNYRLSLCATPA